MEKSTWKGIELTNFSRIIGYSSRAGSGQGPQRKPMDLDLSSHNDLNEQLGKLESMEQESEADLSDS
jgi:hypothetical protein